MKLSVCYLTCRLGGLDMFCSSLSKQTDTDYELIMIDDAPGRVARGHATQWMRDLGLPLACHRTSKPANYFGTRMGLANAMNTAYVESCGDFLVFIHDYSSLPENAVANWKASLAANGPGAVVHGVAHVAGGQKPASPGDVRTWHEGSVTLAGKWLWAPEGFELFYLGVPAALFREINGVDERGDYAGQFLFNSLVFQLKVLGYHVIVDRRLDCVMVDHRDWDGGRTDDADDGQWRIRGHHTTIPHEPRWKVPSPNPFDIEAMRAGAGGARK